MFDGGHSGFDSEIWGDAEQMLQAFRRTAFSALLFRLADSDRFDAVKQAIESDPRLTLEAKRETRFYADQSETLAKFITYLGTSYPGHQDLDTAVRAIGSLAREGALPRLRLRFVGKMPTGLREAIVESGLGDVVEATGFVKQLYKR